MERAMAQISIRDWLLWLWCLVVSASLIVNITWLGRRGGD
jgi:hypothetical protein